MILQGFSAPASLSELSQDRLDAWNTRLKGIFSGLAASFPSFYDPTTEDTPEGHAALSVTWPAFPGTLLSGRAGGSARWKLADSDRNVQDEYCEWSVARDADGNILSVTFTTEVPDYYDHLMDTDRDLLLDLYEAASGQRPTLDDLLDDNNLFVAANRFNNATDGSIVHLVQRSNNLRAAVILAAEATVLREQDGAPVVHPQTLVQCGGLGEPLRHSDPQIASAVNNLVRNGTDVTLADPSGLYIDGLETTGMETPDGADAQEFWSIERGTPPHALRARFEVPQGRGYTVSDITINGQPIQFGAQIAERVQIRLDAIAKPSTAPSPTPEPCIG